MIFFLDQWGKKTGEIRVALKKGATPPYPPPPPRLLYHVLPPHPGYQGGLPLPPSSSERQQTLVAGHSPSRMELLFQMARVLCGMAILMSSSSILKPSSGQSFGVWAPDWERRRCLIGVGIQELSLGLVGFALLMRP